MKQLRTLLVGMGKMGRNHFRVISEDPRFQLMGVLDPHLKDQSSLQKHEVPYFKELSQISAKDFDVAVIAVPTAKHFETVQQLLPFGKSLLVEKPIASTPEQGKLLLEESKAKGVRIAVGHVERFNPAILKLKELLHSQWMGQPIHFSFTRVGGYPNADDQNNNVLLDLAVHDLDVMTFLAGPIQVSSSVCHSTWKPGVLDTAEILVSTQKGVSGSLHVNWVTPTKIRTLRVTGTQGVCFVDYILQTVTLLGGNLLKKVSSPDFDFTRIVDEYRATDKVEFGVVKQEPLKAQLGAFYRFALGESSEVCTLDEGLQALLLAHDAIERGVRGVSFIQ